MEHSPKKLTGKPTYVLCLVKKNICDWLSLVDFETDGLLARKGTHPCQSDGCVGDLVFAFRPIYNISTAHLFLAPQFSNTLFAFNSFVPMS